MTSLDKDKAKGDPKNVLQITLNIWRMCVLILLDGAEGVAGEQSELFQKQSCQLLFMKNME